MSLQSKQETVTPATARKWLEQNRHNRPVTGATVEGYSIQMGRGQWLLNPADAITFDYTGRLLNGQHRLLAVIQAGVSIQVMVTRGADPEAFKVLDTGRKKGGGDVLSMEGETNATLLAASLGVVRQYEYMVEHDANSLRSNAKASKLSNTDILDALVDHPGIRNFLAVRDHYQPKRILIPSIAVAGLYLTSGVDPERASQFFERVGTGADLTGGMPEMALRNRLLDNVGHAANVDKEVQLAWVIRAWNAAYAGRTLKQVTYRPSLGEDFPRIAGFAKAA